MPSIESQSYTLWRVIVAVFHLIGILLSCFSLVDRVKRRRVWIDDWSLGPSIVFGIINAAVMWFICIPLERQEEITNRATLYWLSGVSSMVVLWCTRITMALTLTRIFPTWGTIRRFARGLSVSYATLFVGIMCWFFASSCSTVEDGGYPIPAHYKTCNPERWALAIMGISADLFAFCLLVMANIYILAIVIMSQGQQTLLVAHSISTGTVFLATIVTCVVEYGPGFSGPGLPAMRTFLFQLELALSLIACNVVTIVTFIYRRNPSFVFDDAVPWKKLEEAKPKPRAPAHQPPSYSKSKSLNAQHHIQSHTSAKSNETFELHDMKYGSPSSNSDYKWAPEDTFAKDRSTGKRSSET